MLFIFGQFIVNCYGKIVKQFSTLPIAKMYNVRILNLYTLGIELDSSRENTLKNFV